MVTAHGIAAGCVLYQPRSDHLYLGRLAVAPAYRGQGIGAWLVRTVEAHGSALGLPSIRLSVRLQIPSNQRFYTGLGYRVVSYGSHPGYVQHTSVNMEKWIDETAR